MSLIVFLVSCLLYVLKIVNCTIDIVLLNNDVIENNRIGEKLQLQFSFDESFMSIDEIQSSRACIMINGKQCQCSDDFSNIVWTESCACILPVLLSVMFYTSTDRTIASQAILVSNQSPMNDSYIDLITLTLPLTLDDLSRVTVLTYTLQHIDANVVKELLIFVPDYQFHLISPVLQTMTVNCRFPTVVYKESVLFLNDNYGSSAYTYGIQMAIKLLCSQFVKTKYYLTLDADVVLIQVVTPNLLSQLINVDDSHRSIYENESRSVHPTWWQGSAALLGVSVALERPGIGVTPAILSTYGSLLTVNYIYKAICASSTTDNSGDIVIQSNCIDELAQSRWLNEFGRNNVLWSEYTLYRLVLDKLEIFDGLHVVQSDSLKLHCNDVWFEEQLPWKLTESAKLQCLLSVVQSSSGVNPSRVYEEYIHSVN